MAELTIVGNPTDTLSRQAAEVALMTGFSSAIVQQTLPDSGMVFIVSRDDDGCDMIKQLPRERMVTLVHPSAVVSSSAQLGANVFVGAQSLVNMNAEVGDGVTQNALSTIEHDNRIGDFTFMGTGAILCGHVTTGRSSFIGGGATVKPGTSIGAGATLGTGAVLVKDAEAGGVYVGNPAKRIR